MSASLQASELKIVNPGGALVDISVYFSGLGLIGSELGKGLSREERPEAATAQVC